MLRVALTGGIGSGKSTVARMFAAHGAPVVDADEIARRLVRRGQPAYREIVDAFGAEVLGADGEIDRQRLGGRIFMNTEDRRRLEAIVHPLVRSEIIERVPALQAPYCVIVVPLLVEAGMQDLADRILVVDCSEDRQINRVRERSGLSEDRIRRIIATQVSSPERRSVADDLIVNDTGLAHVQAQVDRLHALYRSLSRGKPHPPETV
ncbi:MAG: dephospho-CoA kinase [Acidiferrobacterales bacterium]